MAARLCCRGHRRRVAEPPELTAQPTPTKQHKDDDSHGQPTPPSSPGKLAQCPASRAVRPYRPRGTCGTFAGRRPPKDVAKLRKYNEERVQHLDKLCKDRKPPESNLKSYRDFVHKMLPLETEGSGAERLRSVAAKWKQRATRQDQLSQENEMAL